MNPAFESSDRRRPRYLCGLERDEAAPQVHHTPSRPVARFYDKRGTAEVAAATIKEGKLAVKMTRLSCHRFRSNEVRLWLSVLAYNLANLWR